MKLATGSASLLAVAAICLALCSLLIQMGGRKNRRVWPFTRAVLVLSLSILAIFSLALTLSIQGYRALVSEQLAATIDIEQLGEQVFRATVSVPGEVDQIFDLAGDQLYMDARVLKWRPWAAVLGLNTLYALERVGGRYASLDNEQTSARTVYSLAGDNPLDLFELATRYARYTPFVDAEYGSGAFIEVEDGARYALNVTSSGLVVREE